MPRFVCLTLGASLLAAGCQSTSTRLNAPPHGVSDEVHDLQGTFVYMTDNALLSDMCVSDMHFLPHRPGLTTLGEQRLRRLAQLMNAYGGTLRFNTDLEDKDLIEARSTTIRDYLAEMGVDTTSEVLVRDLRGGGGIDATEAILIRTNEGLYDPDKAAAKGDSSGSLINAAVGGK